MKGLTSVLSVLLEMSEVKDFLKELISGVLVRLVGAPLIDFAFVFAAAGLGFLTLTMYEINIIL